MRSFAVLLGLAPWAQAASAVEVSVPQLRILSTGPETKGTISFTLDLGSISEALCKAGNDDGQTGPKSTGAFLWHTVKDIAATHVKVLAQSATLETSSASELVVTQTSAANTWQANCHGGLTGTAGTAVPLTHNFVYTYPLANAVTATAQNLKTLASGAAAVGTFQTDVATAIKNALQDSQGTLKDDAVNGGAAFGLALAKRAATATALTAEPAAPSVFTVVASGTSPQIEHDVKLTAKVTVNKVAVNKCVQLKGLLAVHHGWVANSLSSHHARLSSRANTGTGKEAWKITTFHTGATADVSVLDSVSACTGANDKAHSDGQDIVFDVEFYYIFKPDTAGDKADLTNLENAVIVDAYKSKASTGFDNIDNMYKHTYTPLVADVDAFVKGMLWTTGYVPFKAAYDTASTITGEADSSKAIPTRAIITKEVIFDIGAAVANSVSIVKADPYAAENGKMQVVVVADLIATCAKLVEAAASSSTFVDIKKHTAAPSSDRLLLGLNLGNAGAVAENFLPQRTGAMALIPNKFKYVYQYDVKHLQTANGAKSALDSAFAECTAAKLKLEVIKWYTVGLGSHAAATKGAFDEHLGKVFDTTPLAAVGACIAGYAGNALTDLTDKAVGGSAATTAHIFGSTATGKAYGLLADPDLSIASTITSAKFGIDVPLGLSLPSLVSYNVGTCTQLAAVINEWGRAAGKKWADEAASRANANCKSHVTVFKVNNHESNPYHVSKGAADAGCTLTPNASTGSATDYSDFVSAYVSAVAKDTGTASTAMPISATFTCVTPKDAAAFTAGAVDVKSTDHFKGVATLGPAVKTLAKSNMDLAPSVLRTAGMQKMDNAITLVKPQVLATGVATLTNELKAITNTILPGTFDAEMQVELTNSKDVFKGSCNTYYAYINAAFAKFNAKLAGVSGVTSGTGKSFDVDSPADTKPTNCNTPNTIAAADGKIPYTATDVTAVAPSALKATKNILKITSKVTTSAPADQAALIGYQTAVKALITTGDILPTIANILTEVEAAIPPAAVYSLGASILTGKSTKVNPVAYTHPAPWVGAPVGDLEISIKVPAANVVQKNYILLAGEMLGKQIGTKLAAAASGLTSNTILGKAATDVILPVPVITSGLALADGADVIYAVGAVIPSTTKAYTVAETKKNSDNTYNVVYKWTGIKVNFVAYTTQADLDGKYTTAGNDKDNYGAELLKWTTALAKTKLIDDIRSAATTAAAAATDATSALIGTGGISKADANAMKFQVYKPQITVKFTAKGKAHAKVAAAPADCVLFANDVRVAAEKAVGAEVDTAIGGTCVPHTKAAVWTMAGCVAVFKAATKTFDATRRQLSDDAAPQRVLSTAIAYTMDTTVVNTLPATMSQTEVTAKVTAVSKAMALPAFATSFNTKLDEAVKANNNANGGTNYSVADIATADYKSDAYKATVTGIKTAAGDTIPSGTASSAFATGLSAVVAGLASLLLFA